MAQKRPKCPAVQVSNELVDAVYRFTEPIVSSQKKELEYNFRHWMNDQKENFECKKKY